MDCVFVSPLTDEQISLLIDGNGSEDLESHIGGCPACRRRYQEAQQLEIMLHKQLHRGDCPSSQTLTDFHMGLLGPPRDSEVEAHLEICSTCREELRVLIAFIAGDEGEQVTFEEPANIIRPSRYYFEAQVQETAIEAIRGGKKYQIRATANNITLFFDIQQTAEGIALEGVLITLDEDPLDWTGSLVEVRSTEGLEATSYVDDMQTFRCEPISQGVFDIRITSPSGYSITVSDLQVIL